MSPGLLVQAASDAGLDAHQLSLSLNSAPAEFLTPSLSLHSAALALAKRYLDPLAISTSELQQERLASSRRKRKRGKHDDGEAERSILKLKEVYLDGFTLDGVWSQARRVLETSSHEVERTLHDQLHALQALAESPVKTVQFDVEGFEVDSDDNDGSTGFEDSDEGASDDLELEVINDLKGSMGPDEYETDGAAPVQDGDESHVDDVEDIEADSDKEGFDDRPSDPQTSSIFIKDKHGLNDGFFDIDEFNKDSEFLERADQRGDDDGAASDEEDVDWGIDPMMENAAASSAGKSQSSRNNNDTLIEDNDNEDDSEGGGPTFGDADLDAPWSDDDEDMVDADLDAEGPGIDNTNEVHYEDFFEPPPRALTKTKRMRALPKTQPKPIAKPSTEDVSRVIDSHQRDLFDDDFSEAGEEEEEEDELAENVPGLRNLSSHEKRRLTLAKQIRELEAASVAKRDWQLSGEATAHVRPENALLEEDLAFERAGKPVPVITADVSTSIEDMIKQRIISRQFDEVVKRRPGTEGHAQPRRGLVELSDQKDTVGLAENYEQAYLAHNDPNAKDARTEAEMVAHAEIQKLWSKVSHELDALCSLHFKPKPADIEVRTVTDAPKIFMEEARPSVVEGINDEQGGLAPQELFRVGESKQSGEDVVVTTKGGTVVAREELTKEQKLRKRRRDKERARKQEASDAAAKVQASAAKSKIDAVPPRKSRKEDETDVLKTLKAGGVKVIGKGGRLQDVDGQQVKKTA